MSTINSPAGSAPSAAPTTPSAAPSADAVATASTTAASQAGAAASLDELVRVLQKSIDEQGNRTLTIPLKPPDAGSAGGLPTDAPKLQPPSAAQIDSATLMEMIQQVKIQTAHAIMEGEEAGNLVDKEKMEAYFAQNIKKLQDAQAQQEQQKQSALIGQIFGWIAAALAIIVSAIVAVVSFGTASAVAAICATAALTLAVTMTVLMASGVMEQATEALSKAIEQSLIDQGYPKRDAKIAGAICAMLAIQGPIIIVQIALAIPTGGASMGGVFAKVSEVVLKVAKLSAAIVGMAQGAAMIAAGSAQTAAAVQGYQATMNIADVEKNKAYMAILQAMMENTQAFIKQVIETLQKSGKIVSGMIDTQHQYSKILVQNISEQSAV